MLPTNHKMKSQSKTLRKSLISTLLTSRKFKIMKILTWKKERISTRKVMMRIRNLAMIALSIKNSPAATNSTSMRFKTSDRWPEIRRMRRNIRQIGERLPLNRTKKSKMILFSNQFKMTLLTKKNI